MLAVAGTSLVGCRGTMPEAGLPRQELEKPFPRVTSNDRGYWYLLSDPDENADSLVEIASGERKGLFYATRSGLRSSRLMPLSPGAYSLLDSVRDQTVEARRFATPTDSAVGGVGAVDSRDGRPAWSAGGAPPDGSRVVLVTPSIEGEPRIGDWIAGYGQLKGGKITGARTREGAGPYLVLPQPPTTGVLRVATTPSVSLEDPASLSGVRVVDTDVEVRGRGYNRFLLAPVAMEAGADVLLSAGMDAGWVAITVARPMTSHGIPISLTVDTFEVQIENVPAAIAAMAAIYDGAFLLAAAHLAGVEIASGRNVKSGEFRKLELAAAGGWVDWTRAAILQRVDGLGPDVAYYLARAHAVGGDAERARDFAERAVERFVYWGDSSGFLGRGGARRLQARLAASRGEFDTAADVALEGASDYAEADDEMRAAEMEMLAAQYLVAAGEPARAAKSALFARSRFYHGNSPYASGLAEIVAADVYRLAGERVEAEKMAKVAGVRFEELGAPIARNRARVVEGRVRALSSSADGRQILVSALERATELGDPYARADAAASLVELGGSVDATLAAALLEGLPQIDQPLVRARTLAALDSACGAEGIEGLGGQAQATFATICAREPVRPVVASGELGKILATGWSALTGGDGATARRMAEDAIAQLDDDVRKTQPLLAAEAHFLQAAVTRSAGGDGAAAADHGVALLRTVVDPTRLATTYATLGEQMAARGQAQLASTLFGEAVAAARADGQNELARTSSMRRVVALHSLGDYDGVITAAFDAEPVLQGAGAAANDDLARLWVYEADALRATGRGADAALKTTKVEALAAELPPADRLQLGLLRAELALSRGNLREAEAALKSAEPVARSLAEGERAAKLARARLASIRARLAEGRGKGEQVVEAYRTVEAELADQGTTDAGVVELRVAALGGLARWSSTEEEFDDAVSALQSIEGPRARRVLAMVQYEAGYTDAAADLLRSSRPTTREDRCGAALVLAVAGDAKGLDELRSCGPSDPEFRLMAVLLDDDRPRADRQRVARELLMGQDIEPRLRERLTLVTELYEGENPYQETRRDALRDKLSAALEKSNADRKARAVSDLASYLTSAGRPSEALDVIDANSAVYYDVGPSGAGELARLRAEAMLAELDVTATQNFVLRAVAETPDIRPADEAAIRFASAKNAALMGMWQQVRALSNSARAAALEAGDRRLVRDVEAFARRFGISLR